MLAFNSYFLINHSLIFNCLRIKKPYKTLHFERINLERQQEPKLSSYINLDLYLELIEIEQ